MPRVGSGAGIISETRDCHAVVSHMGGFFCIYSPLSVREEWCEDRVGQAGSGNGQQEWFWCDQVTTQTKANCLSALTGEDVWHVVNHVQLGLGVAYLVTFGWHFIQCFPTSSSQAGLGSRDSLDQLPLKHSCWFQLPFPCDPLWGKCEDQNN